MIKRILCFSNPAYLKLKLNQIVIEIPEVVYGKGVPDNLRQEGVKTAPMRVTDKQFGDMELFDCKHEAPLNQPVQQLELF